LLSSGDRDYILGDDDDTHFPFSPFPFISFAEVEHQIQEKMGHVKGVMEDAVHTVSNGIDEVIMGKKEMTKELQNGVDEMQNGEIGVKEAERF
jgi:hypothetical protein